MVISDFLAEGWERLLGRLSARHQTLAVEIIDPRSSSSRRRGTTLVDPESGRRREVQTSSAKLRPGLRGRRPGPAGTDRCLHPQRRRRPPCCTDRDWLTELVRFVVLRRLPPGLPRRTS
ncbi:MAG: hypothetical protein R2749_26850 [Acidimicrobiales bacterium]